MDLLQTVRKEGSRGGRDLNFSWDNVKNDAQRENYLGHSLMAPVGRWQKGKDLNWYAKGEAKAGEEDQSEDNRKRDEMRKVKEAEEDAMARALGLPPPDRSANSVPLGLGREEQSQMNKALKEALVDGEGDARTRTKDRERAKDRSRSRERRHHRHRWDETKRRRSRSRDDERRHRRRSRSDSRDRHRHRSRSRERRRKDYDERSTLRDHKRDSRRHRERSRSPYRDEYRQRRRDDR